MNFESICILVLLAAVLLLLAPIAWGEGADELPDVVAEAPDSTEETISNNSPDASNSEQDETVPTPTVAPFDFVLLEESSVKAVERLDEIIDIFSGFLFFLGVSSGMLFFKVLADRIRTV